MSSICLKKKTLKKVSTTVFVLPALGKANILMVAFVEGLKAFRIIAEYSDGNHV